MACVYSFRVFVCAFYCQIRVQKHNTKLRLTIKQSYGTHAVCLYAYMCFDLFALVEFLKALHYYYFVLFVITITVLLAFCSYFICIFFFLLGILTSLAKSSSSTSVKALTSASSSTRSGFVARSLASWQSRMNGCLKNCVLARRQLSRGNFCWKDYN